MAAEELSVRVRFEGKKWTWLAEVDDLAAAGEEPTITQAFTAGAARVESMLTR